MWIHTQKKIRGITTRNKVLLRQIKQEGIPEVDYDNEELTNQLILDYQQANVVPMKYWSYQELITRLEELYNITHILYTKYPGYYRQEYSNSGEYWDIVDEIQDIAQSYYADIYE